MKEWPVPGTLATDSFKKVTCPYSNKEKLSDLNKYKADGINDYRKNKFLEYRIFGLQISKSHLFGKYKVVFWGRSTLNKNHSYLEWLAAG